MVIGKKRAGILLDRGRRGVVIGKGDGDVDQNGDDNRLKPAWAFFAPLPLLG